jgi:hypothetical protein
MANAMRVGDHLLERMGVPASSSTKTVPEEVAA